MIENMNEKKQQKVYGLSKTKKFGFTFWHLVGVNLDPGITDEHKFKLVFDSNYLSIHLSQICSHKSYIYKG
jgi:hypothetical protein